MKLVIPLYGLGNVMFQYAFLCELRARSTEACCFFKYRTKLFDHNGYELDKLFTVQPYKGLNVFQRIYIHTLEFMGNFNFPNFFFIRLFFKTVRKSGTDSFIYFDEVFKYANQNVAFWGMWQSPKYFPHVRDEIMQAYQFNIKLLSPYTCSVLKQIESCNSVCIHLRRGDYINDQYDGGFSLCCPPEYYKKAMQYINQRVENPSYFVFSDDIAYAKVQIKADRIFFVEGNERMDSWQDMFLMSCCNHNIIANSTFSWWGAYLNKHQSKIVITPKKWWFYLEKDDVVPEEWIRL